MVTGSIIGSGDIASALREVQESTIGAKVFLASGLSNSKRVTYADFKRERAMILKYSANHVIYFSSLSIYYSNSVYAEYKKDMEAYIKETCKRYTIIRIGNITWGKNPNTILNYFRNHQATAHVQEGYRYLIEKDEFLHWMNLIPNFNTEMNLTGTLTTIKQVYERAIHTNK